MIDPGRAFGTGAHPTTRLTLELLQEQPPGSLLDVGCGSGVLSIAAAKLGFAPIVAVDVDPVAVAVTRENAATNAVSVDAQAATRSRTTSLPQDLSSQTSRSTSSSGCCRGSRRGGPSPPAISPGRSRVPPAGACSTRAPPTAGARTCSSARRIANDAGAVATRPRVARARALGRVARDGGERPRRRRARRRRRPARVRRGASARPSAPHAGRSALAAPQDAAVALTDPAAIRARRPNHALPLRASSTISTGRPRRRRPPASVVLGPADRPLLDELVQAAGPDEADEAEVDVDHPLSVGIVEDGRLLAIASLLEFGRGTVDVGVLVHPHARRRGYAVTVVADISRRAGASLVQYRCDPENKASAKVAAACGFIAWGVLTHRAALTRPGVVSFRDGEVLRALPRLQGLARRRARGARAAARRRAPRARRRRRRRGRQHLLRHARGRLEVAQGGRARRADASPRLRHRLRRESRGGRVRRPARERRRRREAERGDAGVRRRRRRRDRLRAGRRAARPRARVREGAGRLLVLVQLLRHPARARRVAQPRARTRCSARSRAASRRATARSCSPASTSAATATATPATTCRGSCARQARRRASSACGSRRSRSTTSTTRSIAALRETPTVSRHLHVPLQSGDDGVLRAMGRRYSVATYLRRLAPLQEEFNLTSDVIVGFPAEDERAFANTLRTARDAGLTKIHVFPYSPRPGTVTAQDDPVPPAGEEGARRAAARRVARRVPRALAHEDRPRGRRARRPPGPRLRRRLLAVARRPSAPVGELVRVRGAGRLGGGESLAA